MFFYMVSFYTLFFDENAFAIKSHTDLYKSADEADD